MNSSDQPKPALPPFSKEYLANEHDSKHFNQPKPKGEWTVDWVAEIGGGYSTTSLRNRAVANAHNAALAAVLEEYIDEVRAAHVLQKQLSAEREEWQLATEDCHRIISRKNEELAAEREKVSCGHNCGKCRDCLSVNLHFALEAVQNLEHQLAAERDRRQRAEEWSATLAKLADDNTVSYNATCDQLRDQLAAELEKVQELVEALHVLYTSKDQELRKQVYHAALLAKVEGYPLPDGRTS